MSQGTGVIEALLAFSFYYPLFMSYLWIAGAILYYLHRERNASSRPGQSSSPAERPPVSVIVPCYNEADQIRETVSSLLRLEYPELEVVLVNDGSSDATGAVLDELAQGHPHVRAVHLARNLGKATALRTGTLAARHEYVVCIDGDAMLDPHAITWLVSHFVNGPRVGAVTGNPRIRTRSTLLGKIQVGEFSSIVGLIKRAQRLYGRVFTVSGVVSAYRKSALHDVGYWDESIVTDDIDVSWSMQLRHWDIRFEPNALCWILMPETLRGLWRQRLRWAVGGTQVLLKNLGGMRRWKVRRMWPVYLEYFTSLLWAYIIAGVVALWLVGHFVELPPQVRVESLVPQWTGVMLAMTCLIQFAVALAIDARYERGLGRYYYWIIWYPVAFWMLNVATSVVALPKALLRERRTRGTWSSPDRGIRDEA